MKEKKIILNLEKPPAGKKNRAIYDFVCEAYRKFLENYDHEKISNEFTLTRKYNGKFSTEDEIRFAIRRQHRPDKLFCTLFFTEIKESGEETTYRLSVIPQKDIMQVLEKKPKPICKVIHRNWGRNKEEFGTTRYLPESLEEFFSFSLEQQNNSHFLKKEEKPDLLDEIADNV